MAEARRAGAPARPRPNGDRLVTFDPARRCVPTRHDDSMEVDRNGLEVLPRSECLRLLRTAVVGRVALTASALPTVLPVSFVVDGDEIVFRTGRDAKLDAATRDAVVAFEVDEIDPTTHSGWSVVVTGVAREVTDPGLLSEERVRALPGWGSDGHGRVVALATDLVSGRRLAPRVPALEGAG